MPAVVATVDYTINAELSIAGNILSALNRGAVRHMLVGEIGSSGVQIESQ